MADWYPVAIRDDGPADKQGYTGTGQRTNKEGAICHSMVGSWASGRGELFKPMAERRASWTFSVLKDGRVFQHYGIRSVTWHGGSRHSNERWTGIENEGGPLGPNVGEALEPAQEKSLIELLRWLGEEFGWTEWTRQVTLWEHKEQTRFGSKPTACPSGRIPWAVIQAALTEEDDMAFIGVGCDKGTIGTNKFESFRLYVTASGLTRESIPTSAQREALAAAGYPLLALTKAQLAQYKKA